MDHLTPEKKGPASSSSSSSSNSRPMDDHTPEKKQRLHIAGDESSTNSDNIQRPAQTTPTLLPRYSTVLDVDIKKKEWAKALGAR
jgi:hypothetical protein